MSLRVKAQERPGEWEIEDVVGWDSLPPKAIEAIREYEQPGVVAVPSPSPASNFTPLDAWGAFDARMGEHVGEDPTEGGLYTILEQLGLDAEQLTIATQAKLPELLQILAISGLPGLIAGAFAVGALWKDRSLQGYESPTEHASCPDCGKPHEGSPVVFEDPVTGKSVIYGCVDGHHWDRGTGKLI
jgi:hypothetical protein